MRSSSCSWLGLSPGATAVGGGLPVSLFRLRGGVPAPPWVVPTAARTAAGQQGFYRTCFVTSDTRDDRYSRAFLRFPCAPAGTAPDFGSIKLPSRNVPPHLRNSRILGPGQCHANPCPSN